jgi:Protein of unknown function (DUF3574)
MAEAQAGGRSAAAAFGAALLFAALAGCAPSARVCPLADERPMRVTELFFGRDIAGRAPLTDSEWSEFAASVISKEFPAGFTVLDGDGQWRDASGRIVSERTKVLLVATSADEITDNIARVRDAYHQTFNQTSVGVVTYAACGAFGE